LRAMCDSFEKSVFLALAKESKTLSPETILTTEKTS